MKEARKPSFPGAAGRRIFRVLAGYELAVILLVVLMAATFFGTLEQKETGLYLTQKKYFDMSAIWLQPRLQGKAVPIILPGVFWTGALLFVNLTLGGIVRARKGWNTLGVLIAHAGILFLLAAGFVAHLEAREGSMIVYEGERSDYAKSYHEPSIEISGIGPAGGRKAPFVVPAEAFEGLKPEATLTARLPDLPFDLVVRGFQRNAELVEAGRASIAGAHEPVVDGFFLRQRPRETTEEMNRAGCYATVVDKEGNELRRLVLHQSPELFPTPVSVTVDGVRYELSWYVRSGRCRSRSNCTGRWASIIPGRGSPAGSRATSRASSTGTARITRS